MILKDARDLYYYFSGKTSDLVRQLGLAGIAVIWIFRGDAHGAPKIPEALFCPLILIVVGLAFDLLHYAVATAIWGCFQRYKEVRVTEEDEFKAPRIINWPSILCFALKTISVIAAYVYLLGYLARTII